MQVSRRQTRAIAVLAAGCLDTLAIYISKAVQNTTDRLISDWKKAIPSASMITRGDQKLANSSENFRASGPRRVEAPSPQETFHHRSQNLPQIGSTLSDVSTWLHIDPPGIVGVIHRGNQFGIACAKPSSSERRIQSKRGISPGGTFPPTSFNRPRDVFDAIAIRPLRVDDAERA